MKSFRPLMAALAVSLALPLPAIAQDSRVAFDLHFMGLRAGAFAFSAAERDADYAVTGRLESTGLVGAIRKVRYDAQVTGRRAADRFVPASYQESSDNGRRQVESRMNFQAGVPQVMSYSPPREPSERDVDPATQAGTVDPLTALYAVLRDVPVAEACQARLAIFDGRRRSEVAVGNAQANGNRITCNGEYRRVAGYSERDMAERRVFPFNMTYVVDGDIARVTEVTTDSIYGRAVMRRR
ncbi:DUF3108 domain-containing protein [Halodurantibacterium flavum]|uniref:DUF3108 domain-containing protein n=1 Tax=Halodurantibacterium flavum TaxID=1382802 RepID=A0ABW4S762_9RHOB